MFVDFRLATVK